MAINERIRQILFSEKIANKDVAEWLGMTSSRLSQKLKDEIWDSVEELKKISEKTGYRLDWIVTGNGDPKEELAQMSIVSEPSIALVKEKSNTAEYLKGSVVRPITVTVDRQGKELVSYVPVKAQAGYMRGYADAHYIEKLPAFTLPALTNHNTYRMFEVDGPSMQQLGGKGLKQGDIIIAQYVEDILAMKDNLVYVVVSTEGVAIKRVINRLKNMEDPMLIMTSDNKGGDHPTYSLKPKEIKEVWMAKRVISSDFSFDTDLFQMLGDIQHEQIKMKEEIKQLKGK